MVQHRGVEDAVQAARVEDRLRDVANGEAQVGQIVALPRQRHHGGLHVHAHHLEGRVEGGQGVAARAGAHAHIRDFPSESRCAAVSATFWRMEEFIPCR